MVKIWFLLLMKLFVLGCYAKQHHIGHGNLLDLVPPVSSWPVLALNIRNEAEVREHVEKYADILKYIQDAERNTHLDPSVFRKSLLTSILVILDATAKMSNSITPTQLKFRKDFDEAVRCSMQILERQDVKSIVRHVFPLKALEDFVYFVFKDIAVASETVSDARVLLTRLANWLELWRAEIRDASEHQLRRIVKRSRNLDKRQWKFSKHLQEYRRATTTGEKRRTAHQERKLVHMLGSGALTRPSAYMALAIIAVSLLFNL